MKINWPLLFNKKVALCSFTDDELFTKAIDLLAHVKEKITDDSDVVWTRFDKPVEFRDLLDLYITQLQQKDALAFKEIDFLFGPTGSLQEHSLTNGWGQEFITLSEQSDKIVGTVKKRAYLYFR